MRNVIVIISIFFLPLIAHAQQETVFTLFKADSRLADEYFANKNYEKALDLYLRIYTKSSAPGDTRLKIGRCYFYLKQYKKAAYAFENYARVNPSLSKSDAYCYAESQASAGNYRKAVDAFRELLKRTPEDTIAAQKLWRLNNIQYVYEDSLHYFVRPVPSLNSGSSEIFIGSSPRAVLFLSNREQIRAIEKLDYSESNFYQLYTAITKKDTLIEGTLRYGKPTLLNKQLDIKLQAGPLSLFNKSNSMVFVRSSEKANSNGNRTLQLYFADLKSNGWTISESFPFNSESYSITDPSITEDGLTLYFSSDMPGGKGGKDIYRSQFINGKWTSPENLVTLNTPFDEVFPYIHRDKTFYFASNGHAGMGGLDIFKMDRKGDLWDEVTNAGYPINSSSDDFALVVDSVGTHGYFSSNRKQGGFDDDIYEVDMDLQTYPLTIPCLVRIKDHNWSDSSDLKPFASAKFALIDNVRNVKVYETTSDESGNLSLIVPYFSKYKIKVVGPEHDEHIVNLDISKHRKEYETHEIVLVKDIYQPNETESREP